jgi:hypothetical protein
VPSLIMTGPSFPLFVMPSRPKMLGRIANMSVPKHYFLCYDYQMILSSGGSMNTNYLFKAALFEV